ncbi:MAG: motility associated factor glycosyltransferase family protein [Spirochaetes bacterium]|nr:motility associated factor glycosyltransferase family protein [Spirochaetota bacterium]
MNFSEITYRIEQSGRGPDTIIVRDGDREMPLHSRVDPEREAESYHDRFDPARFDVLIVLGVGLGYHLLPAKKNIDSFSQIILIDVIDGIGGAIARNRLTSFLVESPRVTLITGKSAVAVEELLAGAIDMDAVRGISVLEHPASMRMFGEYYSTVKKSIEKLIHKKAGDMATRKAFGPLYLRNIVRNITLLGSAVPVKALFGFLKDYPAVIAASGASLDGDIDELRRFQERCFIIAVDSALPALRAGGIVPDIVITIDPQPYVYEHFLNGGPGSAIVVHSISSHPSVIQRVAGYLSLNSHPLSQVISELTGGSIGSIDSATGTVAGDAVSLCMKTGCSVIGITGLDFSFSGYAIYARGTAYQKRYAVYFHDRFATVEGFNCRYILTSSGGYREGGRFTRKAFMQYRHSTEDFISSNRLKNICLLNGRGLPLSGVPVMDIGEFAKRNCNESIRKKRVLEGITAAARRIDGVKIATALGEMLRGKQLDELIEASLGGSADAEINSRLRNLIAHMIP